MIRQRVLSLVAAATVATVVLGGMNRAEAALRLSVTSNGVTDVFYSDSSTALDTGFFTIDNYNLQVQTVTTNFPGTNTTGTLSTTVNITGTTGTPHDLTSTVDVINTVAGIPGSPTLGTQVTGANETNVLNASLLSFTGPSGSPVIVSADSGSSDSAAVTSGTVTTTTYYNGAPVVTSDPFNLVTKVDGTESVTAPNSGTYTLGQQIVLTGLNAGATVNYTGASGVAAPEPATFAMVASSLPILGFFWVRRRSRS